MGNDARILACLGRRYCAHTLVQPHRFRHCIQHHHQTNEGDEREMKKHVTRTEIVVGMALISVAAIWVFALIFTLSYGAGKAWPVYIINALPAWMRQGQYPLYAVITLLIFLGTPIAIGIASNILTKPTKEAGK